MFLEAPVVPQMHSHLSGTSCRSRLFTALFRPVLNSLPVFLGRVDDATDGKTGSNWDLPEATE